MFPGVKTPGYSQDVPPGQRNLVAAFCGKKATRFTNDAFKAISRLGCRVRKLWETIAPPLSGEKNVGPVQLAGGGGTASWAMRSAGISARSSDRPAAAAPQRRRYSVCDPAGPGESDCRGDTLVFVT